MYTVTVRTADVTRAETAENVQLSIRGSAGTVDLVPLKEHAITDPDQLFQQGSTSRFQFQKSDVGTVNSLLSSRECAWRSDRRSRV